VFDTPIVYPSCAAEGSADAAKAAPAKSDASVRDFTMGTLFLPLIGRGLFVQSTVT
jgi:hypothetical protein